MIASKIPRVVSRYIQAAWNKKIERERTLGHS